jgi:hypothetical protein
MNDHCGQAKSGFISDALPRSLATGSDNLDADLAHLAAVKDSTRQPLVDASPVAVVGSLLTVNVSGSRGSAGADGTSFAGQRAKRGHDGQRGGDGGPAQRGQNAGDVEVFLKSSAGVAGLVALNGLMKEPRSGRVGCSRAFACGSSSRYLHG